MARWSIQRPLYPWLIALSCLFGGLWGIDTVGRLENPEFPIKFAYVLTQYPGASASEVEGEVTDRIEASLLELPYVKEITSFSIPGRSEIQVELLEQYGEAETPQIWDELRRRVNEAAARFPPGASTPHVEDDFGDIYGILYAVQTPGYSPGQIQRIAEGLERELRLIEGVAKVRLNGLPPEAVYIELRQPQLVRLGLPIDAVLGAIGQENLVRQSGSVPMSDYRLRIAPEAAYDGVEALRELRIGRPGSTEIIRLADIANITRGPIEDPIQIVRHNGEDVFTVGVSVIQQYNVVDVGDAVERRLQELLEDAPVGVEAFPVHEQHDVVRDAINEFLRNLVISVLTVLGALCIFMGWRAGTVVGVVLFLTVLGSVAIMALLGIELQRISLGALMIAMGMLVDNAIVVAEGMVVGVQRGLSPTAAAEESVERTQLPLLGATIIGLLAFAPIGLSDDDSGHFLISLFQVVAIALLLSWALAVTLVPLLGSKLLTNTGTQREEREIYRGAAYAAYRWIIGFGLRRAWLATTLIVLVTAGCMYSFAYVKTGFFPSLNSPLLYVDFMLPEGTDIRATSRAVSDLEERFLEEPEVESVTSFMGSGLVRFTAITQPEQVNPAMTQMIIRVQDHRALDEVVARFKRNIPAWHPDAQARVYRGEFTPSGSAKIEARFHGSDALVLRDLGNRALDVYRHHGVIDRQLDWGSPALSLVPEFAEERARIAGITRADLDQELAFATTGVGIGLLREGNRLVPVIARAPHDERSELVAGGHRMIWSPAIGTHVPLDRAIDGLRLAAEDNRIGRRQRQRVLTAEGNPPAGLSPAEALALIREDVETLPMPPGYSVTWGGEHEASLEANEATLVKLPQTYGLMFLITLLLFGALRQAVVIWLTVPMVLCGLALTLLVTGMNFTFPTFLGLLSLTGMLIKNCVVLVDEIDKRLAEGPQTIETMRDASVSRLRPVMLAAGTTIAGMAPLLGDAFFAEMAAGLMGGLGFATLITLLAVPVFYRIALGRTIANESPDAHGAAPAPA